MFALTCGPLLSNHGYMYSLVVWEEPGLHAGRPRLTNL